MSERGNDVSDGTKVFGVNLNGPRKFIFNAGNVTDRITKISPATNGSSTDPSRKAQSLFATRPTSSLSSPAVSVMTTNVLPPLSDTSSPEWNASLDTTHTGTLASLLNPVVGRRRASTVSAAQESTTQRYLNQIIQEFDSWCKKGSPGSRSGYLRGLSDKRVSACLSRTPGQSLINSTTLTAYHFSRGTEMSSLRLCQRWVTTSRKEASCLGTL